MKHAQLQDFDVINLRSYVEKPDANFSAKRNYQILEETMRENDEREARVDAVVKRNAENVADILASYGVYRLGSGGTKKVEDYLGKEWMKKVYGDRLYEKIKYAKQVQNNNLKQGNTLFGGNFYLPGKD